jgi:hypothetical protein
VADGGEDDICSVALTAFETAAAEMANGFHVSDDGFDCRAAPQFALDDAEDAALLTRDEDATRIGRVVAARACVYRKPKPGCTGGEVRRGSGVTR